MKGIIIFQLILLLGLSSGAQTLPAPQPLVSDELRKASMEFIRKNADAPGVMIRVYRPGKWDWGFANGINSIAGNATASPELVFRAASISKLICATAVLQLASKGVLSLNDKIGTWLPKEYVAKLKEGDRITVRNLLQHTSGLYEPQASTNFLKYPTTDFSSSILSIIANQELNFNYNDFFYSSANYTLLAEIVKIASGMSYREYLEQRIFKPLNLNETSVDVLPPLKYFHGYIPASSLPNYMPADSNKLVDFSHANMSWAKGSADICSSTKDLTRFYAALNNGKILPKNWVDSMTLSPVTPRVKQKFAKYGYGTMIFDNDFATGHFGNGPGYSNFLCKIAGSETYVCVAMNGYFIPFNGFNEYLVAIGRIGKKGISGSKYQ